MFYEDNPLTVKYKEKIKESENSVNEIRETFVKEKILMLFTKDIDTKLLNDDRQLILWTFIKTSEKNKNYPKLKIQRHYDNTSSSYSYLYMNDTKLYFVDDDNNEPFIKVWEINEKTYFLSKTLVFDEIEKVCQENHYSYERDEYSFRIFW